MKIYLAGVDAHMYATNVAKPPFVLVSYYYFKDEVLEYLKSDDCESYIIDSGAFTFLSSGSDRDINEYAKDYANFIEKHDLNNYIELDLYSIIGIEETEKIREMLFEVTGKQPIPVWHKSLGIKYFHKLINKYDYVAIGGIVTKDIKRSEFHFFEYFIDEARKAGCKLHALGLTNQKALKKYPFYSVDSTSWIGARFGMVYHYSNGEVKQLKKPDGMKLADAKEANTFSAEQWVKLQRYAYLHY